jgi:hypothetical protein
MATVRRMVTTAADAAPTITPLDKGFAKISAEVFEGIGTTLEEAGFTYMGAALTGDSYYSSQVRHVWFDKAFNRVMVSSYKCPETSNEEVIQTVSSETALALNIFNESAYISLYECRESNSSRQRSADETRVALAVYKSKLNSILAMLENLDYSSIYHDAAGDGVPAGESGKIATNVGPVALSFIIGGTKPRYTISTAGAIEEKTMAWNGAVRDANKRRFEYMFDKTVTLTQGKSEMTLTRGMEFSLASVGKNTVLTAFGKKFNVSAATVVGVVKRSISIAEMDKRQQEIARKGGKKGERGKGKDIGGDGAPFRDARVKLSQDECHVLHELGKPVAFDALLERMYGKTGVKSADNRKNLATTLEKFSGFGWASYSKGKIRPSKTLGDIQKRYTLQGNEEEGNEETAARPPTPVKHSAPRAPTYVTIKGTAAKELARIAKVAGLTLAQDDPEKFDVKVCVMQANGGSTITRLMPFDDKAAAAKVLKAAGYAHKGNYGTSEAPEYNNGKHVVVISGMGRAGGQRSIRYVGPVAEKASAETAAKFSGKRFVIIKDKKDGKKRKVWPHKVVLTGGTKKSGWSKGDEFKFKTPSGSYSGTVVMCGVAGLGETAAPKAPSDYKWYTYQGTRNVVLKKAGREERLTKGTIFGVRDASSKTDTTRIIVGELGHTIIFSIPSKTATSIVGRSKPSRTKLGKAPVDQGTKEKTPAKKAAPKDAAADKGGDTTSNRITVSADDKAKLKSSVGKQVPLSGLKVAYLKNGSTAVEFTFKNGISAARAGDRALKSKLVAAVTGCFIGMKVTGVLAQKSFVATISPSIDE